MAHLLIATLVVGLMMRVFLSCWYQVCTFTLVAHLTTCYSINFNHATDDNDEMNEIGENFVEIVLGKLNICIGSPGL